MSEKSYDPLESFEEGEQRDRIEEMVSAFSSMTDEQKAEMGRACMRMQELARPPSPMPMPRQITPEEEAEHMQIFNDARWCDILTDLLRDHIAAHRAEFDPGMTPMLCDMYAAVADDIVAFMHARGFRQPSNLPDVKTDPAEIMRGLGMLPPVASDTPAG